MAAPVLADDIVAGAVTFLGGHADVLAELGHDPGLPSQPWLFQYRLWTMMEGTQSTAAVISHDGGWAGPNLHNTLRFPRLTLSIWADPIRDDGGSGTDPGEVQRRLYQVFTVIDAHLHRPQGETQMWGSIRTVSCARLTEPTVLAVGEGDGLVRLQTYYAVTQG